jgi:hypothetical protein
MSNLHSGLTPPSFQTFTYRFRQLQCAYESFVIACRGEEIGDDLVPT